MSLLVALIIGGFVGWLAAQIGGRSEGFVASVLIGIVGSFIGSFISTLFTGGDRAYLAFSWVGVFWSFVGALVLVFLMNAFQGRSASHHM